MIAFLALLALLTILILTLLVASTQWGTDLKKSPLPSGIPTDPSLLPPLLNQWEKRLKPKPGTEKKIFFNSQPIKKEKISIVYLHGFTASRREVSPVFENVAKNLGAPLYMTRFSGHGLGGTELGETTKEQWINDALEAYQIGLTLGDEVILACMSTGCALGLYLAYFFPEKIKGLILFSPNLAPADARSFLANGPFGKLITQIVLGKYRRLRPANSRQAYYWTMNYGTSVVAEMISLVTSVKRLNLEQIAIPTLTIYTPFDSVISTSEIRKHIPRLSSPHNKIISLTETEEHVIAGEILNPTLSERVIRECMSFLLPLLGIQNVYLRTGSD